MKSTISGASGLSIRASALMRSIRVIIVLVTAFVMGGGGALAAGEPGVARAEAAPESAPAPAAPMELAPQEAGPETVAQRPVPFVKRRPQGRRQPSEGAKMPSMWWQEDLPQPAVGPLPFRPGERIEFQVKVLGKEAGRVVATVRSVERRQGQQVLLLEGTMKSSGFFDNIYPVDDRATSLFDPRSATPVFGTFTMRQNRRPEINVEYDFDGGKSGRVRGRATSSRATRKIDERTPLRALDPLSVFYHLRARDLREGERFSLFVHNGRRTYRLDVRVGAVEKVWTEFGLRDGLKLAARASRADGTRASWSQEMTFWLSTDSHRLPLRLIFDMPLGHVEASLASVQSVAQ